MYNRNKIDLTVSKAKGVKDKRERAPIQNGSRQNGSQPKLDKMVHDKILDKVCTILPHSELTAIWSRPVR